MKKRYEKIGSGSKFSYTCNACQYTYTEIYTVEGYKEIGKPFLQMAKMSYKDPLSGNLGETRLYACPNCGTLQIEV